MNVNFYWSVHSGESMCRISLKNVTYVFILTFSISAQHILFFTFGWFMRWGRQVALQHILLILLGWFVRWEASGLTTHIVCLTWMVHEMGVNGLTAAVLHGAASRIYSKQHAAFLCSSHLAFSWGISLKSKWHYHSLNIRLNTFSAEGRCQWCFAWFLGEISGLPASYSPPPADPIRDDQSLVHPTVHAT